MGHPACQHRKSECGELRFEQFRANIDIQQGQDHAQLHITLTQEGVHNDAFKTAEAIKDAYNRGVFEGIPITVNHPSEPVRGRNRPKLAIGHTENTVFNEDDASVEADAILQLDDPRVQGFLDEAENDTIPVSIGFWATVEQDSGSFQGESYTEVEKQINDTDHVAILTDDEGACSTDDGCGLTANKLGQNSSTGDSSVKSQVRQGLNLIENALTGNGNPEVNARSTPRTPEFEGTETADEQAWGPVDVSWQAFVDGYFRHNPDAERPEEPIDTVEEAPQALRNWAAAKSLNGEADATSFDNLMVLPVVNPGTNQLNEAGLIAAKSRAPQTEGVDAEATQTRIDSLLQQNFDQGDGGETDNEEDASQVSQKNGKTNEEQRPNMDKDNQESCGCESQINELEKQLEAYQDVGSLEEVKNAMELADEVREQRANRREELVEELVENTDHGEDLYAEMSLNHLEGLRDDLVQNSTGSADYLGKGSEAPAENSSGTYGYSGRKGVHAALEEE